MRRTSAVDALLVGMGPAQRAALIPAMLWLTQRSEPFTLRADGQLRTIVNRVLP